MKKAKTLPRKERPKLYMTAQGHNFKCPPKKAVIRARTLRGLSVSQAAARLSLSPAKSAYFILKVLKCAINNAMKGDPEGPAKAVEGLTVDAVRVDKARPLKRHHPVSHGAAKPLIKRYCHITVQLRYDEAFSDSHSRGAVRERRKDLAREKAESLAQGL
jgi:ribosomal protein L22